jgi:hypothetical protein
MEYDYSFTTWPRETWGYPPDVYRLLGLLGRQSVTVTLTEEGFERFRSDCMRYGLQLCTIRRTPATSEAVPEEA